MPFEKGNELWQARTKHGVDAMFNCPSTLLEACVEYFNWIKESPLIEEKVGFSKGTAVVKEVKHPRAMTLSGLALFLGVTTQTVIQWRKKREDLRPVLLWAEQVIWNQKFSNAAVGLMNPVIIARELGLADKQQHDVVLPKMMINPPSDKTPEKPPIHGE